MSGKVALVTGGGTGLGRAIGLRLGAAGCAVAVNWIDREDEVRETLENLRSAGVDAHPFQADVSDRRQVEAMVEEVVERFDGIDYLVNNAGTTVSVPTADLEAVQEADWDRILAVNTKGPFLVTRAAASPLRRRRGSVVIVSSMSALITVGSSIPYCVSKAGSLHLMRCLAVALAPHVRVNAVCPGYMETAWTAAFADRKAELAGRALLERSVPVEDVAEAVCGLLTNGSLTGEALVVDAGTVVR